MAEIENICNFSRSLTGAEIKSLKLHPGDTLGLEMSTGPRRRWKGSRHNQPAFHLGLAYLAKQPFFKKKMSRLFGHRDHRGEYLSCANLCSSSECAGNLSTAPTAFGEV